MNPSDLGRLMEAVELLETPRWTARMTQFIRLPMEWALKRLPPATRETITSAAVKSIEKALGMAVSTMNRDYHGSPFPWLHRGAAGIFGGVGGFFGFPGLVVELPFTTALLLRSIADIARSEGENIEDIETKLACIQVFGLGGTGDADNAADTGYYAVRLALARAIADAGEYIARKGAIEEGAPVIMRMIIKIAARFNIVVTEKLAAEALPIIGAAGGATINLLFMRHFQEMARGHFIVRNLERKYGAEVVRKEYEELAARLPRKNRR